MHEARSWPASSWEFMGNPAALGFLGLQELGEVLQPPLPGLHFSVELGIGEAVAWAAKSRANASASASKVRPDSSPRLSAPITRPSAGGQGQHRAHRG